MLSTSGARINQESVGGMSASELLQLLPALDFVANTKTVSISISTSIVGAGAGAAVVSVAVDVAVSVSVAATGTGRIEHLSLLRK